MFELKNKLKIILIYGIIPLLFVVLTACQSSPYKPSVGMTFKQADSLSTSTNNGGLEKFGEYKDYVIYETWSQQYDKRVRGGRIDSDGAGYFLFKNGKLITVYDFYDFRNKVNEIDKKQNQVERMGITPIVYNGFRNKYQSGDPLGDEILALNDSIDYLNKQRIANRNQSKFNSYNHIPARQPTFKPVEFKDFRYKLIEN